MSLMPVAEDMLSDIFHGFLEKYGLILHGPGRDKICLQVSEKARLKPVSSATETS